MLDGLARARRTRPPGNSCSRCGAPYAIDAIGWHWLSDDRLELVCPGCTTQGEADEIDDRSGERLQRSYGEMPRNA